MSQLVNMIATKFKRLYYPCFRSRATRLDYCGNCSTCGLIVNYRWRLLTESLYAPYLIPNKSTRRAVSAVYSLFLLPDSVGMSFLLCKQAEIYVMSFLLPVTGRHLPFTTRPYTGQYSHLPFRVVHMC